MMSFIVSSLWGILVLLFLTKRLTYVFSKNQNILTGKYCVLCASIRINTCMSMFVSTCALIFVFMNICMSMFILTCALVPVSLDTITNVYVSSCICVHVPCRHLFMYVYLHYYQRIFIMMFDML